MILVAMTIINLWKEYWPSWGSNWANPIKMLFFIKASALCFIMIIFFLTLYHTIPTFNDRRNLEGGFRKYTEPKKNLPLCLNAIAVLSKRLKMPNDLHIFGQTIMCLTKQISTWMKSICRRNPLKAISRSRLAYPSTTTFRNIGHENVEHQKTLRNNNVAVVAT